MKKLLALLLVFLMLVTTIVGCSEVKKKDDSSKPASSEDVAAEPEDEEIDESDESDETEDEAEPEDEEADDELADDEEADDSGYYDDSDDYYEDEDYDEESEEEEPSVPLTPEEQRLENMLLGKDTELNKDAIYNEGNLVRLAKAMKKSKSGKEVTIVFYGNAVNLATSSDASKADAPYSQHVEDWWINNVGPCEVITSGLENLTSINACMRVDFDVLQYKPDLVFLDFSVQDGISNLATTNSIGYDNLVRRILQSKTAPAVVSLLLTGAEQESYTMNPKNANMFATASKQQKQVAKHYNLPVIDFEEAVWENFTELVKVTTKKEIPLIDWSTVSINNTVMNNDGHTILGGAINYFLENNVLKKLNKISTKEPKYPTDGFFGVDKYMKGSFLTVTDILENTPKKGYSFDLDETEMAEFEYTYRPRPNTQNARDYDALYPHISTYRHFIAENREDEDELGLETNPHYLTMTIPEVTNSETYFMMYTTSSVSSKSVSHKNMQKFAPIALYCYDKNDNLTVAKAPSSNFTETTALGKTSATKIPVGTTRVEFRIYTTSGTVRLLGIGEFK